MNTKLHIGLDVHKNSIVAACAHAEGGEPAHYGKWGGSNLAAERGLLKLLKKFGLGKGDVRICYEAGPTGFVLARRLLKLGYDCILVARTFRAFATTTSIPSPPKNRLVHGLCAPHSMITRTPGYFLASARNAWRSGPIFLASTPPRPPRR